jgi:hypothetical protein
MMHQEVVIFRQSCLIENQVILFWKEFLFSKLFLMYSFASPPVQKESESVPVVCWSSPERFWK